MTHTIPDRFRVGEVWMSPRLKRWKVARADVKKGVLLVSAEPHNHSRKWRSDSAIGDNMMNAWLRIDPPHEANQ
jgi:hypothetical protein